MTRWGFVFNIRTILLMPVAVIAGGVADQFLGLVGEPMP